MTKEGRAYGFFSCYSRDDDRSPLKEEIEGAFPGFREDVNTPSNLELSLTEGYHERDDMRGDIRSIAHTLTTSGMEFVLSASLPGGTNREASDELASILGHMSNSSRYDEKPFRGMVVYDNDIPHEGEQYVLRV